MRGFQRLSLAEHIALQAAAFETRAHEQGVWEVYRAIRYGTDRVGLYPRFYRDKSVSFTPMRSRHSFLFTASHLNPQYRGRFAVVINPKTFSEFFPVTIEEVGRALGNDFHKSFRALDLPEAIGFAENLVKLLCGGESVPEVPRGATR